MDTATRIKVEGEIWRAFTGPEFLAALQGDQIQLQFCDNGTRVTVQTPRGPATWDWPDGPAGALFRAAPG